MLTKKSSKSAAERKIHRNATPINMNFAHENSLRRKTQRPDTVNTLSSRIQELPGYRRELNYNLLRPFIF